jgi:mannosyl-3-phosphoglycerate phosphatase
MRIELTPSRLVVITDLDGTLLDQRTYSYDASLSAIGKLRARKIPLVLCSSKTAAEIIPLQRELELREPFICESGGAIYLPRNYFPFDVTGVTPQRNMEVIEFGKRIFYLRQALHNAARDYGVVVKSFGTMTFQEIMFRTGLTLAQAIQARQREYDEPFCIESGDAARLFAALEAMGFTVTQGGRFYHITGDHDKGHAVKELLAIYRRQYPVLVAVGMGNSANDLPLLRETDIAVAIRNPDGQWDPQVIEKLPEAQRSEAIGPQGWREAMDRILDRFAA